MTGALAVCFCLAALNLGAFTVGAFALFARRGDPGPSLPVLGVSALLAAAATLAAVATAPPPGPGRFIGGCCLLGGALALFVWAARVTRPQPLSVAFSPDPPVHLLTEGPYRYVRHPFYLSYLLTYVGGFWLHPTLWLGVVIGWLGFLYARAAQVEERKFLASPWRDSYLRYAARTGRFLPRLGHGRARRQAG